jgi:hypothetical protein
MGDSVRNSKIGGERGIRTEPVSISVIFCIQHLQGFRHLKLNRKFREIFTGTLAANMYQASPLFAVSSNFLLLTIGHNRTFLRIFQKFY